MNTKMNLEEVRRFIVQQAPSTKIYLGADSERVNVRGEWVIDYTLVVVVHFEGSHGCKVFGEIVREKDYLKAADKPQFRLMNEVAKCAQLYLDLASVLVDRHVEIHLDLNPSDFHKSNEVVNQAKGYVKGVCGFDPMIKPMAPAASFAADRLKEIMASTPILN